MAEVEKSKLSLEAWLMIGLVVSVALSTVIIAVVSSGKTTVFSPYQNDDEYADQQLTLMRESLKDFNVANTMSTPMLVNDWQNPHRTLLVIAAPEKPFDAAEAAALHDFVTKRGGKVILAANSTNAQLVAEEFGVKYFDSPVRDDINTGRYYEVTADDGTRVSPDTRKLWSVASVTRDISTMGDEKAVPCSEDDVNQELVENCRMPVLFHRPTAIQVLDEQGESGRSIHVLAAASTSAEIDAGKGSVKEKPASSFELITPDKPSLTSGRWTSAAILVKSPQRGALCSFPTTRCWPTTFGTKTWPRRRARCNATPSSTFNTATCAGTLTLRVSTRDLATPPGVATRCISRPSSTT